MKTTTTNNNRRGLLFGLLALASLALLLAACAGVTPRILGGLPVLPGSLGLSYSLVNLFIK